MRSIRHILVATDFGPASQRAVAAAFDLAVRFTAKVTVVHVLEIPDTLVPLDELCKPARRSLHSVVSSFRASQVDCTSVIRVGERWHEIVRAAQRCEADLVVVGSHGRRGIANAILGSVAEKVVRHSPIPVLTVHGYWFDDRGHAGQELGDELAALRTWNPAIIAISRGGIAVAAEASKTLGVPLDVLLTRPLRYEGAVFGALSEEGTVRLDPKEAGRVRSPEEREKIIATTLASLKKDALGLRGTPWFADLWGRTVILVSDALTDSCRASAAATIIKEAGADRILVAAPVVTEAALAALGREFDGVIVLHSIPSGFDPSTAYRDFQPPSKNALADTLSHFATTAA